MRSVTILQTERPKSSPAQGQEEKCLNYSSIENKVAERTQNDDQPPPRDINPRAVTTKVSLLSNLHERFKVIEEKTSHFKSSASFY